MAYDEGLAERVTEQFSEIEGFEVKKMFGGLCFLVSRHMCCGIVGESLMARVGPDMYEECLGKPHTQEMDFTGRAMKGMVFVDPAGIEDDEDLKEWIGICLKFVRSLPPKK